ncbi:MAG: hypothetical protein Q8M76_09470, partial [Spirochaetaceae bacterium]|nr:hypothetical protein [Spirochaetaceae bacterium]
GLVGLGVIIAALGTTLVLTMPAGRGGAWFGDATEKAEGDPRLLPGFERGYRWTPMAHRSFPGSSLFPLLFVGLAAFAIAAAFRHGMRRNGRACDAVGHEDAIAVLRREFAEGRISEEEYRQRQAALRE